MSQKVLMVLKGFYKLSTDEKAQLIADINKYQQGNPSVRFGLESEIYESVRKSQAAVNFGPAPGSCPCCGR